MARKPKGETPSPPNRAEKNDAAGQSLVNFIEVMAGRGMPLDELGLLMVPPLSESEIKERYRDAIAIGRAKTKAQSVTWVWESAEKGNVAARIYLSKVFAGWSEKGGVGENKEPPETEMEANSQSQSPAMPSKEAMDKIYPFPSRK